MAVIDTAKHGLVTSLLQSAESTPSLEQATIIFLSTLLMSQDRLNSPLLLSSPRLGLSGGTIFTSTIENLPQRVSPLPQE